MLLFIKAFAQTKKMRLRKTERKIREKWLAQAQKMRLRNNKIGLRTKKIAQTQKLRLRKSFVLKVELFSLRRFVQPLIDHADFFQ